MVPDQKKAVVEASASHGVWNFPCIWELTRWFNIETKDLQNLCVCANLALDKPENIQLVDQ